MMGIWGILGLVIWVSLLAGRAALEPLKLEVDIKPIIDTSDDGLQPRSSTQTRIVGGKEAIPHSLPWQAGVIHLKTKVVDCGGTILAPKFVMTAGHCTMNKQPSSLQVWAGYHNILDQDPAFVSGHRVAKINNHPNFKYFPAGSGSTTVDYSDFDFSILEVNPPIKMRDSAKALYLPRAEDGERLNGESVFVVSGWGNTKREPYSVSKRMQKKLLQVSLPLVPDQDCQKAYKGVFKITKNMVCAGDLDKGNIDACTGDSGGPMAWLDPVTDEVKLIGVVSFGRYCAVPRNPGVYAELSTVIDWIKSIVGTANEDTCAKGNCMTNSKLKPKVSQDFQTVTPHNQKVTVTMLKGPLTPMSV